MKILITGATGLIGSKLCLALLRQGHTVRGLARNPEKAQLQVPLPIEWMEWESGQPLPAGSLQGVNGIVHLAGESIAGGRWTAERKQAIIESRTKSTQAILESIHKSPNKPSVFFSASAVGYYGDTAQPVDERSPPGVGFLSEVVQAWEKSSETLPTEIRRVIYRFGVVLAREGGAVAQLEPIFRAGVGGPVGGGKQWMSWIHIDDAVAFAVEALESPKVQGTYNLVAPGTATNQDFTKALAQALARPGLAPVPALAMKAAFGEMAQVLLESQHVQSNRLQDLRHRFQYVTLPEAFRALFPDGDRVFEAAQWVARPIDELFAFFSDAKNLEIITPEILRFKIRRISTEKIAEGTEILYRLSIHGVPARWLTLIKNWNPPHGFVDEQLKGPYQKWHHTHGFEPLAGGTLLTDQVRFRLPLGFLGDAVAGALVLKDVRSIFEFRKKTIRERF